MWYTFTGCACIWAYIVCELHSIRRGKKYLIFMIQVNDMNPKISILRSEF